MSAASIKLDLLPSVTCTKIGLYPHTHPMIINLVFLRNTTLNNPPLISPGGSSPNDADDGCGQGR
jgi:hypothetical protein